ncbi:hypothetical protein QYF61_016959 [Mycteria americana]|uniref:Uncharacterized protein n=1 Tax=Mycteria americana TaxID=33587 RepID=A0AAN7MZ49_MYCAM|nr:hypothetical protein QYF61_016959 [Mycteria americana]
MPPQLVAPFKVLCSSKECAVETWTALHCTLLGWSVSPLGGPLDGSHLACLDISGRKYKVRKALQSHGERNKRANSWKLRSDKFQQDLRPRFAAENVTRRSVKIPGMCCEASIVFGRTASSSLKLRQPDIRCVECSS